MGTEKKSARVVRGLVKATFILCYAAFMWASIHHLAAFFNNFEADSNNTVGSYALAAAFDVTALVTTIGVMFFRKSMPRSVQGIVWGFIIGIALYSFFMNWEYTSHYQSASLILQPTGATTAVYDANGTLRYVPVMEANTRLLFINPVLASGFTLFALIYSIIAEFFGTKAPTVEELQAKKKYLEDTQSIVESIRKLEGNSKGKGFIQRGKEKAIEAVNASKEVRKALGNTEESIQESEQQSTETIEEIPVIHSRKVTDNTQESTQELIEEKLPSWLSTSGSTVSLQTVVEHTNISIRKLHNRVESKQIRATKNKDIVYKDSLIAWMKAEGILQETEPLQAMKPSHNGTVTLGFVEQKMYDALVSNPDTIPELLQLSQEHNIDDFTAILKAKYKQYASYITPERVAKVITYVELHNTELIELTA